MNIRVIFRQLSGVVMFLLLFSCSTGKEYEELGVELNSWYRASYDGNGYFFCIDGIDGKEYAGSLYCLSDWPVADRHSLTVRKNAHSYSIAVDGEDRVTLTKSQLRRLETDRYTPPEYDPQGFDQEVYRRPEYEVSSVHDVVYGSASGYYTSLSGYEENNSKLITEGLVNTLSAKDLEMEMDIYTPKGKGGTRPLVMFIHGGAFYAGDKAEPAYVDLCTWFASLGYVTASINYRLGFKLSNSAIRRAGYKAVQDANAAMRYLVHNARTYGIDTTRIYVAGSSAGAITALNMEFMNNDNRPECVDAGLFREGLGDLFDSGNNLTDKYDIKAIASLWGGLNDLNMLSEGNAAIILFHGTDDEIIPYDEGYPFSLLWEGFSSLMFEKMYGSYAIDREAGKYGIRTVLHSFPGEGHALNVDNKEPNENHYIIREEMQKFLFEEMVSVLPRIETVSEGLYEIQGRDINIVQWQADGGFVIEGDDDASIRVLWRSDISDRTLRACGEQLDNIGFETVAEIR